MGDHIGKRVRANVAVAGVDEGVVFTLTAKHCETYDVGSWLSSGAVELVGDTPTVPASSVTATAGAAAASTGTSATPTKV